MAAAVKQRPNGGKVPNEEWTKTGTCLNKPEEGWIHTPQELENSCGIHYNVRYVGCMEVIVSMKTLDFNTRTAVARESICRVAEAAGLKSSAKRKRDKKIQKFLGTAPNLKFAGQDVSLSVSMENVSMTSFETGVTLFNHSMEEISFASGGDAETVDFVAYVAKDSTNNRACHVIECGANSSAADVIITIAQAFELRYKQMLKRKKQPVVIPDRQVNVEEESAWGDEEPTYYNEGADIEGIHDNQPPPIPPLPDHYSARPSNLPVLTDGVQNNNQPASPLYENTKDTGASYNRTHSFDSPRNEPWFHGRLKRSEAERLLAVDGDFLVRESSNKEGQFVLSGMKNGIVIHLLLVDPEGVVRTKDHTFDNVSHLISYHKDNLVPILSQDIELYLTSPILHG